MSLQNTNIQIVLASKSAIRAKVLTDAGLRIDVMPSGVDETIRKSEVKEPSALAQTLAVDKAIFVSNQKPDALIIGADQVMVCEGRLFDKPANMKEARENLAFLAGRQHQLLSGIALVQNGQTLWSQTVTASLRVRPMTDEVLDAYLAAAGESILNSVGCYRLESVGVQLFEEIDGDHMTIYGMPLLQLLPQLRKLGAVL